jgi:hypothetical protein
MYRLMKRDGDVREEKEGREREAVARCTPRASILVNIIKYNELPTKHPIISTERRAMPSYIPQSLKELP